MNYSRLILAVDRPEADCYSYARLVRDLRDSLAGVKVGVPFLISCGVAGLKQIREAAGDLMVIADLKLADVGDIMVETASLLRGLADAVIAHSFVGFSGALDVLSLRLKEWGMKLVLVASMSHPGSREIYDRGQEEIVELIRMVSPWGVVAPATRPHVIRYLRARLPDGIAILSPGVGAQGAKPGDALCAGADYEIVGRAITSSSDPLRAAYDVLKLQEEAMSRCRRGS